MNNHQIPSFAEMLGHLPEAFVPDAAAGISSTVHLNLTGDDGGTWTIWIQDQQCRILNGLHDLPNLVFSADARDCLDVFTGEKNALQAYMQGKLRLEGDLMLAMKLMKLFDANRLAGLLGYQQNGG